MSCVSMAELTDQRFADKCMVAEISHPAHDNASCDCTSSEDTPMTIVTIDSHTVDENIEYTDADIALMIELMEQDNARESTAQHTMGTIRPRDESVIGRLNSIERSLDDMHMTFAETMDGAESQFVSVLSKVTRLGEQLDGARNDIEQMQTSQLRTERLLIAIIDRLKTAESAKDAVAPGIVSSFISSLY